MVNPPEAQRDHAAVYFPPPLVFALPLLATWAIAQRRPWPIAENSVLLTIGGASLVAAGIVLAVWGVRSFQNANTTILPATRPTTTVVAAGPYRYTRNPMYLGMALGYGGVALLLNNVWSLLALPAVLFAIDRLVIQREERYLARKFGQPYRDYCSRVRRWI